MSNAKHTPGPWTDQFGMAGRPVVAAGNHAVDIAAMSLRGKSQDEAYANARLIAAAPELLAALEALASRDFGAYGWDTTCECIAIKARAAIAKARGE